MNKISALTHAGCLVTGATIGMCFSSTSLAATIYVGATNNSGIENGNQSQAYNQDPFRVLLDNCTFI